MTDDQIARLPELRGRIERCLCVARSSGSRTVGNIELADRILDEVINWSHYHPVTTQLKQ